MSHNEHHWEHWLCTADGCRTRSPWDFQGKVLSCVFMLCAFSWHWKSQSITLTLGVLSLQQHPAVQGLEMWFHCSYTQQPFSPVGTGNFCASYDYLVFTWHISQWHLSEHLGNEVNKEVDQISCLWAEGHRISTVFQNWLIMFMEGLIPPKLVMLSSCFFNK